MSHPKGSLYFIYFHLFIPYVQDKPSPNMNPTGKSIINPPPAFSHDQKPREKSQIPTNIGFQATCLQTREIEPMLV